jgi:hypothetical protein
MAIGFYFHRNLDCKCSFLRVGDNDRIVQIYIITKRRLGWIFKINFLLKIAPDAGWQTRSLFFMANRCHNN